MKDVTNPAKFNLDPTILDVVRPQPCAFVKHAHCHFLSIPFDQYNSFINYVSHIALDLFPRLVTRTPPDSHAQKVVTSAFVPSRTVSNIVKEKTIMKIYGK